MYVRMYVLNLINQIPLEHPERHRPRPIQFLFFFRAATRTIGLNGILLRYLAAKNSKGRLHLHLEHWHYLDNLPPPSPPPHPENKQIDR